MKNREKVNKLTNKSLAFLLMCPGEYDDSFNELCDKYNCTECTEKWLNDEYVGYLDYLEEGE